MRSPGPADSLASAAGVKPSQNRRKQLATADGLIGYTLRARPLARDYWALSVWTDNTALREFMRTPPHVQLMISLKPYMGPTKFVTWTMSAADGRPSMAGALDHLASG